MSTDATTSNPPRVRESANWGQHDIDTFRHGVHQFRQFLEDLTNLVDEKADEDRRVAIQEFGKEKVSEAFAHFQAATEETFKAFSEHFKGDNPSDASKVYSVGIAVSNQYQPVLDRMMGTRARNLNHKRLLGQTVLVGLVTQVELLISHLAHQFYSQHPEALSNAEHKLTLGEIGAFESIDALRRHYVSRKVEGLLRSSVEEWNSFLEKHARVSMSTCATDWPRLVEVFQRRNLLVHEDGRVNQIYLQKTKPSLVSEYFGEEPLHKEVEASREYLTWALDEVEATGLAVALRALLLWNKPLKKEVVDHSIELTFAAMKRGNWKTAKVVCGALQEHCASSAQFWILQLNYWLAYKRLGEWDKVRGSAEHADLSALSPEFQLAHLALTGQLDEFFSSMESAPHPLLPLEALREWPILEEARADARFEHVLLRYPPESPDLVEYPGG